LWSDRLLGHQIAIAPELHFGQEGSHGDLQRLYYDLGDVHILTLKIKEDIEFQRGMNVKPNPEIFLSLGAELISFVWTIEINASRHQ
jgi:hypothetical protein